MTQHIEKFLQRFTDQNLANLQCAAEDNKLVYHDFKCCFVHYHQDCYYKTKFEDGEELKELARAAELEWAIIGIDDIERNQKLLPFIKAEWAIREDIAKCRSTSTCSESSTK